MWSRGDISIRAWMTILWKNLVPSASVRLSGGVLWTESKCGGTLWSATGTTHIMTRCDIKGGFLTARMVFHICETRVCILERILLFFVREGMIAIRAYIKALPTGDGFGLVSTHDLELSDFQNEIPALTNAHLQDPVRAGALLSARRTRCGLFSWKICRY
jgi:hypothetical protein